MNHSVCCIFRPLHLSLILSFLLFGNLIAKSQPVAAFTPSVTEGCAGISISFNNQTTNCTGNVTYLWDFGEGSQSTQTNPVLFFSNGGTFNVSLTVTCDNGSDVAIVPITLYNIPNSDFSATPLSGCNPLTVNFTDNSVLGDGNLNSWLWYFGDGNTSSSQNPQHTYVNSNKWTVSLKVTDTNNCSSTKIDSALIAVANPPVVSFTADVTETCQESLLVNFTPQVSTSFGISYTYYWDFGDGTNSTQSNPQKTFTTGVYTVSLKITDAYGCENTFEREDYIKVVEPVAEYRILDGTNVLTGNTVCKNKTLYFENLTGYSCRWIFGSYQTTNNPASFIFPNPGNVTVTFIIDPGGICADTTVINLFVEEVIASFVTTPTPPLFSCNTPYEISFSNQSSDNAVNFYYVFGDGQSSTNPNISHSYMSPGVYYPALTATSANNCSHTFVGPPVTINTPSVDFVVNPISGCAPLEILFEYTGTTPIGVISNFHWDFGDGNEITDGMQVSSHIYNTPGTYDAILYVTDNNDCTGLATLEINIGEVHIPNIDVVTYEDHLPLISIWPNLNLCAQDSVELYLWDFNLPNFGDYEFIWYIDSVEHFVEDEYMVWKFDEDTGFVTIHMITNNNGCRDTILWDILYISGPIIQSIQKTYDCENTLDYDFTVNHIIGDSFDWFAYYIEAGQRFDLFQNLNTPDDSWSVIFPQPGEYWVQVIAYSDTTGCEFIDSIKIKTADIQAIFAVINPAQCVDDIITFNGSSSIDAVEYMWVYGDGNQSEWTNNPAQQYAYLNVGDFEVVLYVRDAQGCIDSMSDSISILGPEIIIDVSEVYGCNTLENVVFTDMSLPAGNIEFVLWEFPGGNVYGSQVTRSFLQPGTYSVTVTVRTYDGCITTRIFEDLITVANVFADFTAESHTGCVGDDMYPISVLQNPDFIYTWHFGDGELSNDMSPTHQYSNGGIYDVSLHISDGIICEASAVIPDFFTIEQVSASFLLQSPVIPCWPADPGIQSAVTILPNDTQVSFLWDMGNGDTLIVAEPEYLYFAPGNYTIDLNVTTAFGCTSAYSQDLLVQGPYAQYIISNDSVCLGEEVSFQIINQQEVESFMWIFMDGATSEDEIASHAYSVIPPIGYYNAYLELTAGECKPSIPIRIWIFNVVANFMITNIEENEEIYSACSPFDAKFKSFSENDSLRFWFINNNPYGSGEPIEEYSFVNNTQISTNNEIKLIVNDINMCADTMIKVFTTHPLPIVTVSNDTIVCYPNDDDIGFRLFASGGVNYNWRPNMYIMTSVDDQNPLVRPEANITYYVDVYTQHNCYGIDSIEVLVQDFPDIILFPESDTIVIGDTVFISLDALQDNLTYSWTPQNYVSCFDCPEPYIHPMNSDRYTLTIQDSLGCYRYHYYVDIVVIEEYTLDLPKAFTPLGHENNQKVYVRGFGIKNLIQFRIYNRWGEEVFYTDDIHTGWDGYYRGELQNIDSYVYFVEVEMWDGRILTKKGNILLMK